jgi:hypothetical protein
MKSWIIAISIIVLIFVIIIIIVVPTVLLIGNDSSSSSTLEQLEIPVEVENLENECLPKKWAFVYVGQLRTWKKAVPLWHNTFKLMKPDVYLFLNSEEELDKNELQMVFGPDVRILAIDYWSEDAKNEYLNIMETEKFPKSRHFAEVVWAKHNEVAIEMHRNLNRSKW